MAKGDIYRQCDLRHSDGRVDTVWVPLEFGKLNKKLKVKLLDGSWENGWLVTATYDAKSRNDLDNTRAAQQILEDKLEPYH